MTGTSQTFTAVDDAGAITFDMGSVIIENLQWHNRSTGAWTDSATTCTLRGTNPAQNTEFHPNITIS